MQHNILETLSKLMLENNQSIIYGFRPREEGTGKPEYIYITELGLYGIARIFQKMINGEILEPDLNAYEPYIVYRDNDSVRARQYYTIYCESRNARKKDSVVWNLRKGLKLKAVIGLETSAALGFEHTSVAKDKGVVVVFLKSTKGYIKDTVAGIFHNFEEAKTFIEECYPEGVATGIIHANNELTEAYRSNIDKNLERYKND